MPLFSRERQSHVAQPSRQELVQVETPAEPIKPVLINDLSRYKHILEEDIDLQKMYYIHPQENMYEPAREILKQEATFLENTRRQKTTPKAEILMQIKRRLLSRNNLERLGKIAETAQGTTSYRSPGLETAIGWIQILLREVAEVKIPVVGQEMKDRQESYDQHVEKILQVSLDSSESYRRREQGVGIDWEYESPYERYHEMRNRYRHEEVPKSAQEKIDEAKLEAWNHLKREHGVDFGAAAVCTPIAILSAVGAYGVYKMYQVSLPPESIGYVLYSIAECLAAAADGVVGILSLLGALIGIGIGSLGVLGYGLRRLGIAIEGAWWKHQEKVEQRENKNP